MFGFVFRKKIEFQFSIDPSETNKGVQTRLMKLINGSGIGIKASLAETSGKTALVKGLTVRILNGEIPALVNKRVFSLNLGALMGGTT